MAEDYDAQIEIKQKEIESNKEQMGQCCDNFIKAVAQHAKNWYKTEAKSQVEKKTEITFKLEKEQLGIMKSKVNSLADNAENITNEFFLDQSLWWHLKQNSYIYSLSTGEPAFINDALYRVLGKLGDILAEFGYIKSLPPSVGGSTYYPFAFGVWSDEMKIHLFEYGKLVERTKIISQEIQKLFEQKKKHQAQSLWDSL